MKNKPSKRSVFNIHEHWSAYFSPEMAQKWRFMQQGESLLLKQYLPLEFSRKIQWETLQFEPLNSRYVSENLKKATQADVFYKAQMGKETSFFYFHVEHQSTADPLMVLRLLNYQSGFLLDYARRKKVEKVPLLFSLIYYHGKEVPYPYTLDWSDCFESSEEARRYLCQPILIDLTQESDRKIITNCPKTAGVHLVFKYIFTRDFSLYQKQILKALQAAPSSMQLIALKYILLRANVSKESLMVDIQTYLPKKEETIMELYQKNQQLYRQEGLQEGRKEGMQQGIQQGIQQGFLKAQYRIALELLKQGDYLIEKVAQVTGLSESELQALVDTEG